MHALRTTFGTLLSKGGVAPRTAQAAMRHSDLKMTMQVYTDPKLLDVRGALDVLPALPLNGGQSDIPQVAYATGTDDLPASRFAPRFAPTHGNPVQRESSRVITAIDGRHAGDGTRFAASPVGATKNPSESVNPDGSSEWALRDSNPRPHGCDPCALTS